jgi:hypothetical protein
MYWHFWQSEGGNSEVGAVCALHALRGICAAAEATAPDAIPPTLHLAVPIPWWIAKVLATRWAEFCNPEGGFNIGKILGTEATGRGKQSAFKRVDRLLENLNIATEVIHQKAMSDLSLSNEAAIAEVAELFGLGEDRVHKAFYDHQEFAEEVYRRNVTSG